MSGETGPTPGASVIVCTHNRSASLRRSLDTLLNCSGDPDLFEVIVVDNASTDDTSRVVQGLIAGQSKRPLRYLFEGKLGTHNALHAGARAARASLLVRTDDDVDVEPQWVQAYVESFASHPEMVAAGGPALPRWDIPPPAWLRDVVANKLSTLCYCSELALLDDPRGFGTSGRSFFGLNMAIRYETLKEFGGFRPGLTGRKCFGGGEGSLYLALLRAESAVGYVPDARVWHHVSPDRMRPEYFERWATHRAASDMFEWWQRRARTPEAFLACLGRIVQEHWRAWLKTSYTRRRPDARALDIRIDAWSGVYKLVYLWWILSRRELRELLDTTHFGP
jgi:glucosyl-dolichyl phosphate glucuronosyltransferase